MDHISRSRRRSAIVGSLWCLIAIASVTTMVGCGGRRDPVEDLKRDLSRYPEFSLIVQDIRVDEGFMPDYFLQFRALTASGKGAAGRDSLVYQDRTLEWLQVREGIFGRYEHYVGMVIASKTVDGAATGVRQAHPPGYQHVGNPQYGSWGGGGFWQFYGQYAFMSAMLGGHRIGRADYAGYTRNRDSGRPYLGPTKNGRSTFGTGGTQTQQSRPRFSERYRQRMRSPGRGFGTRGGSSSSGRSSSGFGRGK